MSQIGFTVPFSPKFPRVFPKFTLTHYTRLNTQFLCGTDDTLLLSPSSLYRFSDDDIRFGHTPANLFSFI